MAILISFNISDKNYFHPLICPPGTAGVDIMYSVRCDDTSELLVVEYTITNNTANIEFSNRRKDYLSELGLDSTVTQVDDHLEFQNGGGNRETKRFEVSVKAYFPSDPAGAKYDSFEVDLC